jgi:hypothetical protein
MARFDLVNVQSRPDEIANGHVLKTHSGHVLFLCLDGICSCPDAAYL